MRPLLAVVALSGCALTGCAPSLSSVDWPDREPLARDALTALDGVYAYVGEARRCTRADGSRCPAGFLDAASGSRTLDALAGADSTARFTLRAVGARRLSVTVTAGDRVLHDDVLVGRLTRDGLFFTSRWRVSSLPVPVVWGPSRHTLQLGRSSDGTLLAEHGMSGVAVVLVVPLMGVTDGSTYTFARIADAPPARP